MIRFAEETITCNTPLKKFCNEPDVISYDRVIDKFTNITQDICGFLNGNSKTGCIVIGVNNGGYCVGCKVKKEKWHKIMTNLSKVMYATIIDCNSCKFFYEITMYEVNGKYLSKIVVSGKEDNYFLNNNGNVSFFKREEGETKLIVPTEEMIIKINESLLKFSEFDNSMISVGDKYGLESETLEFKLSLNFLFKTKDSIGKYISSFANSNGGKLVVGIKDDGTIEGVRIENSQEWDKIQRDLLSQQHSINNLDFMKKIQVNRIPLKKRLMYLIEIVIPKNEGSPVMVRDANGVWNKWIRLLSCSVKDDRQVFYTKKEYQEMETKYAIAESLKNKIERENNNMMKSISALEKRNRDIIIQINDEKEIKEEYCKNILKQFTEKYTKPIHRLENNFYILSLCLFSFCGGYILAN